MKTATAVKRFLVLAVLFVVPFIAHEQYVFFQAKADVRKQLTDPDSAEFRNLRKLPGEAVCGEVNAKNAYGGYVGFKHFYRFGLAGIVEFTGPNDQRCKA